MEPWTPAAALITPVRGRRAQLRAAERNPADNWVPLHLACAEHAPPRLLHLLLRCWPEAALEADDDGWLPLHVAVARDSDGTASLSRSRWRIDTVEVLLGVDQHGIRR